VTYIELLDKQVFENFPLFGKKFVENEKILKWHKVELETGDEWKLQTVFKSFFFKLRN
jgi:hypothetical protein